MGGWTVSPLHMLLLLDPTNNALAIGARPAMPDATDLLQSESAPRIVVAILCFVCSIPRSGVLGRGFLTTFFDHFRNLGSKPVKSSSAIAANLRNLGVQQP